ncbi:MAG: hypothetical protein U1F11_12435 [Steroidobacteraceae bacterium]
MSSAPASAMRRALVCGIALAATYGARAAQAATEDIEFVAEHLPEVAMDNRYAGLPIWSGSSGSASRELRVGWSRVSTGGLSLAGPGVAFAWRRDLGERWSATAFAFYDALSFSGDDLRPLATVVTDTVPLPLPVAAQFSRLRGDARHPGAGFALGWNRGGAEARHRWVFGLLAEQVQLSGYRADYRILAGPSAGTTGFVDYSHDYGQLTPFGGIEWWFARGRWTLAPHALLAVPLPRRGLFARIAGPGFDLSGDSAKNGRGTHYGDASVTLGVDLTYEPLGLTIDLGSTLTQYAIEPVIHEGVDRNWLLTLSHRF